MPVARTLITMCCAVAIAAAVLVPGARADEYTKLTYLTFSSPVQIPGVTLPAGTYMFKLADPESGRRAIQVWDQEGSKLYTTLLTIPDEMPEPQDEPVVLFSERPAGSPAAVKSWFYPADRIGYEFIYPKDQAMKIAAETSQPVLSYTDEVKSGADEAAMRGAQVGRVDGQGQAISDADAAAATAQTTTTTTTAAGAQGSNAAPQADAPAPTGSAAPTPSANRSEPPAASAAAATDTTTSTADATARQSAPSTTARSATAPSATTTGRAAGSAGSQQAAVGTSGQTQQESQRAQGATGTQAERELPQTASPLAAVQLMSILMIVSALGVRQLRRRSAEVR